MSQARARSSASKFRWVPSSFASRLRTRQVEGVDGVDQAGDRRRGSEGVDCRPDRVRGAGDEALVDARGVAFEVGARSCRRPD